MAHVWPALPAPSARSRAAMSCSLNELRQPCNEPARHPRCRCQTSSGARRARGSKRAATCDIATPVAPGTIAERIAVGNLGVGDRQASRPARRDGFRQRLDQIAAHGWVTEHRTRARRYRRYCNAAISAARRHAGPCCASSPRHTATAPDTPKACWRDESQSSIAFGDLDAATRGEAIECRFRARQPRRDAGLALVSSHCWREKIGA